MRPNVYLSGEVPARVFAALTQDFTVVDVPAGADGVLSLFATTVDDAFLEAAGPQLRVVANYGVGTDNIDLDSARRRGIVVTNTPDVLTKTTAELAVALMLALLRRVVEGDRYIRSGRQWSPSIEFMLGRSLDGLNVAIVGAGRIGREVGRLVEPFGARPSFVGRHDPLAAALREADVVSLHCPLTAETRHLIDQSALATMQPSAILVNTARGPVVDEAALVSALQAGLIAGAALDVFEFEPKVSKALLAMDNVVVTPHIGSATTRTREEMGMLAVASLRAVLLEGRVPPNSVTSQPDLSPAN
jgi:glyoxylate reductase